MKARDCSLAERVQVRCVLCLTLDSDWLQSDCKDQWMNQDNLEKQQTLLTLAPHPHLGQHSMPMPSNTPSRTRPLSPHLSQVGQHNMPMLVLQLPLLAAIACAAAGSTAEPSTEGRVPWPPATEGLGRHLPHLHTQVRCVLLFLLR